jgi:hypothetical protein
MTRKIGSHSLSNAPGSRIGDSNFGASVEAPPKQRPPSLSNEGGNIFMHQNLVEVAHAGWHCPSMPDVGIREVHLIEGCEVRIGLSGDRVERR